MHRFFYIPLRLVLPLLTLVGCSSMQIGDLFSGYAQQMQVSRAAQFSGDFVNAEAAVHAVDVGHNNYGLSQLEKGRLQFLANNWSTSQKTFETAYQLVQAQDEQAKIRISKGIEQIGAVLSNDNAISYQIPRYEQSLLSTYQALNYLYQGNLEGALVEIRRANIVQERALKENKQEIYKAQKERQNKGISDERLNAAYPSMESMIGDVKNGFQNAYTFYLSGLLYEAAGEPNDAYIDYKRALEIYPGNRYLQQDILRLAKKLSMSEDFSKFEKLFGKYQTVDDPNQGQVVIILEQDVVNAKDELKLNLPIFINHSSANFKFFSFALPVYRGGLLPVRPVSIIVDGITYQTEEIVRIQSLASKDLQEQLAGLVTRQALRLVAKEQMRQELAKSGGNVGNILANLYNIASERADTRSWSTLPSNVQILRVNMVKGKQTLSLLIAGKQTVIDVDVKANKTTLINLTSIGNYTGYQSINL